MRWIRLFIVQENDCEGRRGNSETRTWALSNSPFENRISKSDTTDFCKEKEGVLREEERNLGREFISWTGLSRVRNNQLSES